MTDRNANRPGYQKTRVGWIPEEWEVKYLNDIGSFKNGISKPAEAFGVGYPIINIQDLFENTILSEPPSSLVLSTEKDWKTYNLKKGDILFVRSSVKPDGVGLTAIIQKDMPKTVYSGFIIRFRMKKKVLDTWFSSFLFNFHRFRVGLLRKSTISANTNINQPSLGSLSIQIPGISEQQKIAEILSTWDRAIEQTQKLIEAKQQLKKGLMQQLLTGRMRFPGFGAPVEKAGELPEGWEEKRINQIGQVYSGGTPSTTNEDYWDGEIAWLTPNEVTKNKGPYIAQTNRRVTERGLKDSSAKLLPVKSIIVCTRATIGDCVINKIPMATNQGFKSIRPNQSYDFGFIYYSIVKDKIKLLRLGGGSTFLEVSGKDFGKMKMIFPLKKAEQEKISRSLFEIDEEISLLEKRIGLFTQQKKGLMNGLLSGFIRVKSGSDLS